jgi:predicted anti-sigma-YlaC factor YlaD
MGGWRRTTACERARRWISLDLDAETSELEDAALQRHLERCTACASLAEELRGLTEVLRAAPLDEPRRSLPALGARIRRPRPARRRIALVAAFAVSVGSAVAILSVPSPSGLIVPSSALRFANAHEEIEFAQSKNLSLEPFLGSSEASVLAIAVPVFSQRALR